MIAVLKIEPLDPFEIQDLMVFDLDTYHTLITRRSKRHIMKKSLLPCNIESNSNHDLACSVLASLHIF